VGATLGVAMTRVCTTRLLRPVHRPAEQVRPGWTTPDRGRGDAAFGDTARQGPGHARCMSGSKFFPASPMRGVLDGVASTRWVRPRHRMGGVARARITEHVIGLPRMGVSPRPRRRDTAAHPVMRAPASHSSVPQPAAASPMATRGTCDGCRDRFCTRWMKRAQRRDGNGRAPCTRWVRKSLPSAEKVGGATFRPHRPAIAQRNGGSAARRLRCRPARARRMPLRQ
jgi:hypothetical protein